jgi:hypothetical protein
MIPFLYLIDADLVVGLGAVVSPWAPLCLPSIVSPFSMGTVVSTNDCAVVSLGSFYVVDAAGAHTVSSMSSSHYSALVPSMCAARSLPLH